MLRKRAVTVATPSSYGLDVLCAITHLVVYRCLMFFIDKRAHSLCFLPHLVSSEVLCAAGIRGAGEEGQRLCPRLPGVIEGGKHTCDGSQEGDCVHRRLWDAGMPADSVPEISPASVWAQTCYFIGSDQMLVHTPAGLCQAWKLPPPEECRKYIYRLGRVQCHSLPYEGSRSCTSAQPHGRRKEKVLPGGA